MAATFEVSESNGAGETVTDGVSNINFGSTDAANIVAASYPIDAGDNSYEKWIRMHFTGSFNQIDQLKIWKSSGAYVTGESLKTNLTESGYSEATFSAPTASTSSEATNTMPTSEPTDSNIGISGSLSGTLSAAGYSDYCVLQLQTTSSSPAGNVNQKVISLKYREQ